MTIHQTLRYTRELAASAGTDDLCGISTDDVLTWLQAMPSARTAMYARSVVSGVYRFLAMRGLLAVNPLASITMPRSAPGRGVDPITLAEVRRVIQFAESDQSDGRSTGAARARFYKFLWATGLRRGEAQAQLWSDLDLRTCKLTVTRAKVRTRLQVIDVPPWLVREMRSWPRESERIFAEIPASARVRRDLREASVPGRGGYHRFRKGAISKMAKHVRTVWELQQFSRHRDINVLVNHYVTADGERVRRALRRLAP